MNWLAHLLLSEPTPAFRIGNLLPDLVSISALTGLAPEYQRGIRQHRRIDAYTDAHPVFRRSIQRLGPQFRRVGGILVDMFYDHFLSCEWQRYATKSLPDFTAEVYASFETHRTEIPVEAHQPLEWMKRGNWLCSYGDVQDLSHTLVRMSRRFRRPVDLVGSVVILEREYAGFSDDFAAFFPDLREHAERVECPVSA
ncbi:acyl carrier protein phosphodiesterase [Prosthecobacter fusiformis]|uniref:Acyl carrier protein phosphodiesterase n=1 Tax=Prosthecobacter fusiformis TaxID=48464 RepID=A0A4R7RPL8_9BACT|nr:ACP phosphodiesterase [Prosthecobacter fusiformis]TDU66596.1 acyl carrier protein phosphodiesterase [Prosthecobacter fusiformis]